MSQRLTLDLEGLEVDALRVEDVDRMSLESITQGHAMAENSASAVGGCPVFLCSCCCCC